MASDPGPEGCVRLAGVREVSKVVSVGFEHIWGALPFPVFVIAPDDTIEISNPAAEQLLGMSVRQMRRRSVGELFGSNTVVDDTIQKARSGSNRVTQYNVVVTVSDMTSLSCTISVSNIEGREGMLLIMVQPTGSAEKIHRSLNHLSAARSVTTMAGMLAHEIRNPLAGISAAAQLLAVNARPDDLELTELIGQEARRIGKLVDRVEYFVDQRPVEHQPVNIHDVLDRAVRSAQAGYARGVRFIKEFDPSLPDASGDPDQMFRAFRNIIKNSTEAVDDNRGTIRLKTFYRTGIRLAAPGSRSESLPLHVEFLDNGRGIPPDLISEVFEPFVTSKAHGSGLGLSLVSQTIAAHGGLIECESENGVTVFRVRLPVWQEVKEQN